ncbi:Inositol 2-dehydrogenase [Rubripirellula tenax]|uniref:Inositol 2-dehydrogenase n=1 Tax=Rubripirellula tenax TaxID=2528015 RepID=A0A5C6EIP5_9BACT|nr:Gfo/Idh/MocA family oxidoreductase [Rubripirellula tenax]TWU47526.1 Inositol 2-dehydrogenase [Rubripirellula tenax]
MSGKRFRVGIVGAGAITSLVHLPVLSAYGKTKIAWLADVSRDALTRTTQSFDVPIEVIGDGGYDLPDVDVVLVATPVHSRKSLLEHFGNRSIPVLCEKPFALTADDHRSYLSIAGSDQFFCGYMRRTYASIRLLRLIVSEGWFGNLRHLQYSEGGRVGKTANSSATLDRSYKEGGGVLRDLGCHGIDAVFFITGAQDFRVDASSLVLDDTTDRQVDARFIVWGEKMNQTEVDFSISWIGPQSNQITATFDNAIVRCGIRPDSTLEMKSRSENGEWRKFSVDVRGASSSYQAFYLEWENILNHLESSAACDFKASDMIPTTALIDQIYALGDPS